MEIVELIQLVKETLPTYIDKTPKGKYTKMADIGEEGYVENIQYSLVLIIPLDSSEPIVGYFGEDENYFYLYPSTPITKDSLISSFEGKFGKKLAKKLLS